MRKPTMWFPNRSDTIRLVQLQMARSLKFWIKKVEELHYPYSENIGADQLRIAVNLICIFVFLYADCWFCHEAAHCVLLRGSC